LRVTGGSYKGRTILCPPGVIRPAMDRLRESVFAILGDLTGSSFLDLHSGSGAVGIEAASRGAEPVVFVEKDPGKRQVLLRNTSFIAQAGQVLIMPAERFVSRFTGLAAAGRGLPACFDTVFLDPPFRQKGTAQLVRLVVQKGVLAPAGLLLAHLPREELLPERLAGLALTGRRDFGRSVVLFYRRAGPLPELPEARC
jgi:16S rRNA (guanine966-N2)-methyltransferase